MQFGKVNPEDIPHIHFSFIDEPSQNKEVLAQCGRPKSGKVYFGAPVWVNRHWVGSTYPRGTPERDYLRQYARQFNAIELNSTHYHIPPSQTILRWKKMVPSHFRFCPKFPQVLSHQDLSNQALLRQFCQNIMELEENLGTSFLQLPPHFSPQHLGQLDHFLKRLPQGFSLAVELRHPAWFTEEGLKRVGELLMRYDQALANTDVLGRRDVLTLKLTKGITFVRFVGMALHPSDFQRIDSWVKIVGHWWNSGLEEVYFFIHQPDNDLSPDLIRYFVKSLNQVWDMNLALPRVYPEVQQGSLF